MTLVKYSRIPYTTPAGERRFWLLHVYLWCCAGIIWTLRVEGVNRHMLALNLCALKRRVRAGEFA